VADFLKDRETEIRLREFTLKNSQVDTGIPQGSRMSSILYLFCNADLLNICKNITLHINKSGFIDNINILTHSKSIKQNCKNLKHIHLTYEE